MKQNKIIIALIAVAVVGILSIINTTITGNVVSEINPEFPGMGIFLIILFGLVGLFVIKKHHSKK